MSVLIITGFFFQNRQGLGLGFDRNGDVTAVVRQAMMRSIFSGVLFEDPNHPMHPLVGNMTDDVGDSKLSDGRFLSEDTLEFTKTYPNKPQVFYHFERKGPFWVGTWKVGDSHHGDANCIITEVPEGFFEPTTTK